MTFLAHEVINLRVVITFVLSAEDKDGGRRHRFEGVPAGVDVGRFAVVDIAHATHGCHVLQAVLNTGKLLKGLADDVVLDVQHLRRDRRCHRIELVMLAF